MRVRGHDLAVVLGVPVAFAAVAGVLGVASPSSATVPVTPMATSTAAPDPDVVAAADADDGPGMVSEGLPDEAAPAGQSGGVRVVSSLDVKKPVYFITIDDGTFKTDRAMRVVGKHRIPVTAFVTASAIGGDADYFRRITRFGGSVQNHTSNHQYLDRGGTDVVDAVCSIQDRYEKLFGNRPWMLRPPGGFGFDDATVQGIANACGITDIVMWNVVATDTSVQYVRGPLQRGDIVILHFTKGLGDALERVLALGRKQGLHPAAIEDFLPAGQGSGSDRAPTGGPAGSDGAAR